jgi:hypothetical protein
VVAHLVLAQMHGHLAAMAVDKVGRTVAGKLQARLMAELVRAPEEAARTGRPC